MSDTIELLGLRVLGVHGALEHEQERLQPFEVDLIVESDLAPAGRSDDLGSTVDYGTLVERARVVVATEHHQLLEALASSVASATLDADERVLAVTVALRKLRPPLPADIESVGVRLTRRRGDAVATPHRG